jgi:hypothetical protein
MALSRLGELHGVAAADISFGQIQLTDKLRFSRHVMKKRHKDTIRRDVAVKRAADLLARQTDTVYALDALAILQEVMGHFYYKAKVLKTMGADADFAPECVSQCPLRHPAGAGSGSHRCCSGFQRQ